MIVNRREFFKLLGMSTVGVAFPMPAFLESYTPSLESKIFKLDESERIAFVSKIENHYLTVLTCGLIRDYQVMCDARNNHPDDSIFHTDIYVKKYHSTNVIEYKLEIGLNSVETLEEYKTNRADIAAIIGKEAFLYLESKMESFCIQ